MNPANSRICAIVAAIALAAGIAACDKKVGATKGARTALAPSPSAQVIGTVPAEPSGDPPGTTPVSKANEMSKPVESTTMPLPGQPNDHSNLAPTPSQKSDSEHVLWSAPMAKQSNNGTDERKTQ